ncbi:potassium/proton antiporter [Ectothiorhodospira shaposhnikovii]|uniref:potassium/proton antiporter n=1 Tax=Ectothiorhodospira shaposhnikovii TaxID=1054 RepID=UPI001EE9126F|nr:potassium/proton antiporter [Ectothiorhodospira shaposhnikovii]MCG5514386.1 potassium/proton antiporter [Ectothiorhodospira shaposhnikovii]
MDWMYTLILVGAGLIALSVMTSALAFRLGTPLLLVFLAIGLIAGEDGLGLTFNDADTAYFVGSLALAVILFDSGFNTRVQSLKRAAAPAFVLATVGVLLTTLFVGAAARFLFDLPWFHALLLGAIVSSTDAAAVFFLLRTGGIKIYKRVRSMLEVESGSNDPMAILLTILFIELILSDAPGNPAMSLMSGFVLQMGLGLVMGVVGGYLIVEIINRLHLEDALYPILAIACAVSLFAITGYLGGSGFLAIYVAGVVAGNLGMKAATSLRHQQKGMTWLAQIIMFLVLGLFVTPSELGSVLLPALALGLFLILVGRPLAVLLCLLPFRYDRQTITFNAWVGLRGAVSILLGILPAVKGVEGAELFLNTAFIIVITSLLVQGWTIKPVARWLNLIVPSQLGPLERIELGLPGNGRHELLVYRVMPDCPLTSGKTLPRWARPSLIVRRGRSMRPGPSTRLHAGDQVYLFSLPEYTPLLDRLFSQTRAPNLDDQEFFGQFTVNGDCQLSDLLEAYNVPMPEHLPVNQTVTDFLADELGGYPVVGDRVELGAIDLVVRGVQKGTMITDVGLAVHRERNDGVYQKQPQYSLSRLWKSLKVKDQ